MNSYVKTSVTPLIKLAMGLLYYRNSLNCKRETELEISNIETLWSEIAVPNSEPLLLCTVYRPPNANTNWIDSFEQELSIAQTNGLEVIFIVDFIIDFFNCSNRKWLNLMQLFDFKQMLSVTAEDVSLSTG